MNIRMNSIHSKLTLPNLLSGFRFIAAPVLLWLAWHGYGNAFLALLAVTFLTDALDGFAARLTGQVTRFGAMLDSWADLVTYLTIGFGSWWLWRDIVHREDIYVYMIIACYLIPVVVGIIKFGKYTSYHTWTSKLAAVSIGLTIYVLFLGGPAWPFRFAVFIYVIAAIEEIAITIVLPELRTNVHSIREILHHRQGPETGRNKE